MRTKSPETVIQSFVFQAELNPKMKKPVGHISLDFSAQDQPKLSNEMMVQIFSEYQEIPGNY